MQPQITKKKKLLCQGKRYRKRGAAKNPSGIMQYRIGIEKHPDFVESRSRFGVLKVDLIIVKNHDQAIVPVSANTEALAVPIK